jgi:hypothetical protein
MFAGQDAASVRSQMHTNQISVPIATTIDQITTLFATKTKLASPWVNAQVPLHIRI